MNLYGREAVVEARHIVLFARDLSLVTDREYAALEPPA
jgi:hypothetical protein